MEWQYRSVYVLAPYGHSGPVGADTPRPDEGSTVTVRTATGKVRQVRVQYMTVAVAVASDAPTKPAEAGGARKRPAQRSAKRDARERILRILADLAAEE